MAKKNKKIHGVLSLYGSYRQASDWYYVPAANSYTTERKQQPNKIRPVMKPHVALESGDLVKIFKTVSDGNVLWQGDIKIEREQDVVIQNMPENVHERSWVDMFSDGFAAKLERDGKVIFGYLEPFYEQGFVATVWSVVPYDPEVSKQYPLGLVSLEDGDRLTVYDEVYDGDVEWEGELSFGFRMFPDIRDAELYPSPLHVDADIWYKMAQRRQPIAVTPKQK